MNVDIRVWLLDIQQCIEEIYFFVGENRDFRIYQQDLKTKKAVERNLSIIGEAVNRILKTEENFPILDARRIIGTRNRIVHGYDNVSDEVIWTIVWRELPLLQKQVDEQLKRY